ncbi:MAG: hypothetical protein ACK2UP_17195 [Candidatus Promineifilaceae bacterium]|jgi:hypothetical protein
MMNRALLPILLRGRRDLASTLLGYEPSLLFMQDEVSGVVSVEAVNGYNGAYTGVDLNQSKSPFSCPYFDGVNDLNDIYTAGLVAAFDAAKGSMLVVAQDEDWSDSTIRDILRVAADNSNQVQVRKSAANTVTWAYKGGGSNKFVNNNGMDSYPGWAMYALTWDTVADELKAYLNDGQTGSTQSSLPTWVGALDANNCGIGNFGAAATTPWQGWIGPAMLWFGTVLSLSDIQSIYEDLLG